MFIKDVNFLSVRPERHFSSPLCNELEALDTMLLGLVWGIIELTKKRLQRAIDIEVSTEFQLITDTESDEHSIGKRYELTDWRIVSASELKVEEAQRRIKNLLRCSN